MYRFALKTLLADRGKLLTALVGVVFSLVLVNIQGGLYFGLINKTSVLIDYTDADIWVGHRLVENVDLPNDIPEIWLNRIRGLPGVELAEPYIVGKGMATLPDGGYEDVWIIGSEPKSMLGSAWQFAEGGRDDLLRPDSLSIDRQDVRKLGFPKVGDTLEVNGQRAKIVAMTDGIMGFMTTPYLFTNLEAARQYSLISPEYCSYYLVRAKPGTELTELQQAIRERLPDLDVFTADEFRVLSQDYWMKRTGMGVSFGASTLLGVLVGFLMVGQSLYALALDHLTEYATLKAIGADDGQVGRVVIWQALSIAALGTGIGLLLVLQIRQLWSSPLAPIEIPTELLLGSVLLVFIICLIASALPLLRIRRVDPATVLQG